MQRVWNCALCMEHMGKKILAGHTLSCHAMAAAATATASRHHVIDRGAPQRAMSRLYELWVIGHGSLFSFGFLR